MALSLDHRTIKALLTTAKQFRNDFQEMELTCEGITLRVKFSQGQAPAKEAPAQLPGKPTKELRPAIQALSEKPPVFDFGLKANAQ